MTNLGVEIDPVFKLFMLFGLGIVGKILFDWLKSGRIEKGALVTTDHCEEIRNQCCLPEIKREVGVLKAEMAAHEKRLDEGRSDFRTMRQDISKISEGIAAIREVLDVYVKNGGSNGI